jgi:hypothetical protein
MPNSNPYTPSHTTGPNGTVAPDSANANQAPSSLKTTQPGCATSTNPAVTPSQPAGTAAPGCTASPATPPSPK